MSDPRGNVACARRPTTQKGCEDRPNCLPQKFWDGPRGNASPGAPDVARDMATQGRPTSREDDGVWERTPRASARPASTRTDEFDAERARVEEEETGVTTGVADGLANQTAVDLDDTDGVAGRGRA